MGFRDQGQRRRKYPRRAFKRRISVLLAGEYYLCDSEEIGEGGMSFITEAPFPQGAPIVLNFRIPGGDFVSLRALVRSSRQGGGGFIAGVSFENIAFSHKRQVRSFVSSRATSDQVLI